MACSEESKSREGKSTRPENRSQKRVLKKTGKGGTGEEEEVTVPFVWTTN